MRIFKPFFAILRFFGILSSRTAGAIDNASDSLSRDPNVIRSEYEDIVREKRKQLQEIINALGGIQHVREMKEAETRTLSDQVDKMEKMLQGAQVGAKKRVDELQSQGMSQDGIKIDATVLRFQSAFRDNSTTIAEKKARIIDLENDIAETDKNLSMYERQLQSLQREVQKLEGEKHEAVADQVLAKQMKQATDLVANISSDNTGNRLAKLRESRTRAMAEAKQSAKLAGMDNSNMENELLELAGNTDADNEFAALIGLSPSISVIPPAQLPSNTNHSFNADSVRTQVSQ